MSKASHMDRILSLNQLIQLRAYHRGSGGYGRILRTDNLARIGFVARQAGQSLPQLSRLFVQYVLDPISVIRNSPDLRPTELNMELEEQIFYLIAHRRIITALQRIVDVEARQDLRLDTDSRISAVKANLNNQPINKMPWEEPLWAEMLENAALTVARCAVGQKPKVNVRNLVQIGFLSPTAARSLYARATKRIVHFIIDPADSLWNNPYQQPFRIRLSADEIRIYTQIHKMVIELLKPVVLDIESRDLAPLSTQARTEMLHRILNQI